MKGFSRQSRFSTRRQVLNRMFKCLLLLNLLLGPVMLGLQFLFVHPVHATPEYIRVYIDPPALQDVDLTPGTQFSLDISVEYVANLWSYQFWLSFDPEVLQGVSVENGPFLASAGGTVVVAPGAGFDNEVGELKLFAASIFFVGPPPADSVLPDGGGVLATVTFEVAGYGSSPINLGAPETGLLNKTGGYELQNNQTADWEHCYGLIWEPYPWGGGEWVTYEPWIERLGHGYFRNREEEDIPPVASFSYSPADPQIGETVIFDASASYDPDGTIVSYAWDFGDGETSEETDPETTHAYTTAGPYTVALAVIDNDGLIDTATETLIIIAIIHDVAVTSVEASPTQVMPGQNVQVYVIVRNEGAVGETFYVRVYYDANLIGMKTVWDLPPKGYQSLWFEWNTAGVSEGTYIISAEASVVPGESDIADNTRVDGVVAVTVPSITVSPASGPVGTTVRVEGSGFPTGSMGYIMFDDELVGFVFPDMNGDFNATFNVPLAEAGQHVVKIIIPFYPSTLAIEKPFMVIDTTPLDIDADVGAVYFKGETAAFYVQTSFHGLPVDTTSIHATLHKPDGTDEPLTAQRIAVGIYTLEYAIKGKGSMLGTYTLIVNATYSSATINATGTTLKTFVVKSPWQEWKRDTRNAALSIATIAAAIGLIFIWRRENKKLQI